MHKIQKISHYYRILFQIIFYLSPIAVILFWTFFNQIPLNWLVPTLLLNIDSSANALPLSASARLLAALISLIPTAIFMYGINCLVNLFKLYEQGQIFTAANISNTKKLGYTIFAWVIGGIFYSAFLSLLLSFSHPVDGKHQIALTFTNHDLTTLITGGLILLISWIMDEGRRLQEEQDQVV